MISAQRCNVQSRVTLRTPQFGSCNSLRGVSKAMRLTGAAIVRVGVLSRHARLLTFLRQTAVLMVNINRSLSKQSLSFVSGISYRLSSSSCGSPSGSHGSGGSSSNRGTDSSGSYHAVPAWISYEGNFTLQILSQFC